MSPRLTCTVEALGYQGEGICRPAGKATFVPFALPGEEVSIQITKEKPHFAFAELQGIQFASPDRRVPACPVFGKCGGCSLQHLWYPGQLSHKRDMVANSLRKIAGIDARVLPAIGMEDPWAYRNKTGWRIEQREGQYKAGFFSAGSHLLVETETCAIAHPLSIKAVGALVKWLNSRTQSNKYNKLKIGSGILMTRVNHAGQLMLILSGIGFDQSEHPGLVSFLQEALPGLVSFCLAEGIDEEGTPSSLKFQMLLGIPVLEEEMDGLFFSLSPESFFQVNHQIAAGMYEYALRQVIRKPEDTCIDIYSGIGTISLLAARHCRQVFGLELSEASVGDARNSAVKNAISNAEFIAGPAEQTLPELMLSGIKPDAIILDPPRAGAHPRVLKAIVQAAPERVAYISCHPASQARDTKTLLEGGYVLYESQPFDMFPQTAEIENVIIFHKESV